MIGDWQWCICGKVRVEGKEHECSPTQAERVALLEAEVHSLKRRVEQLERLLDDGK